jgi:hypothetical protein
MHGSVSPSKNAWPSFSHTQLVATFAIDARTRLSAGSMPIWRRTSSTG